MKNKCKLPYVGPDLDALQEAKVKFCVKCKIDCPSRLTEHEKLYNKVRTIAINKYNRFIKAATDVMIAYEDEVDYLKGKERKQMLNKIKDTSDLIKYLVQQRDSNILRRKSWMETY